MRFSLKPTEEMDWKDKFLALEEWLSGLLTEDVALAFSGGVDSALLLHLCRDAARLHGTRVHAFTVHSDMHPLADIDAARSAALEAGVEHTVLHVDELRDAGIRDNPPDRCYRCKYALFGMIKREAAQRSISIVLEGTNEDDLHVYRPGLRALEELSILSPLARFHITKEEVRRMAAEKGITVAHRPSSPCMATRFPYGTTLTYEMMRRVDGAESWLRSLGFTNVRVRVHGDIVRLETDPGDFGLLLQMREQVIERMKGMGFPYVTLDLEGFRSGSMDFNLLKDRRTDDAHG